MIMIFSTKDIANIADFKIPALSTIIEEESTEDILKDSVDVSFGDFTISEDGGFADTSLEVTVKNKANDRYSYYITIEAVGPSGARIDTDIIIADELNPKQKEKLMAFDYVPTDKIEQFKTAEFKVLEIYKY